MSEPLPVMRAAAVYQTEECPRTFREDLEAHLLHGIVVSTPRLFMMMREVDSRAPEEQIIDPWVVFPDGTKDAWLVYLLAGQLKSVIPYFPHAQKFVGFQRKNILRFHPFAHFRRALCTTSRDHTLN